MYTHKFTLINVKYILVFCFFIWKLCRRHSFEKSDQHPNPTRKSQNPIQNRSEKVKTQPEPQRKKISFNPTRPETRSSKIGLADLMRTLVHFFAALVFTLKQFRNFFSCYVTSTNIQDFDNCYLIFSTRNRVMISDS